MCFVAHADDVPLLGVLRASAVIGASTCSGGYRCLQDGPTETFFPITTREGRHLSEDRDVFHRHDIQRNRFAARRLLFPASVPALSLTPPTLCPHGWGQVFLIGHCKCHGTITRGPRLFESTDAFFNSLGLPRLGLTTQACHRARSTQPSTRTVCLARTDADRSA